MTKHKKLTFSFNIPTWLYRLRWANIKKYAHWYFNKPKCQCCGKTVVFKRPQVEYRDNHRLMVEWHFAEKKDRENIICKDCLADSVEKGKLLPYWGTHWDRFDKDKVCGVCNEKHTSYKAISVNTKAGKVQILFCTIAWNHDKVCRDCVVKTLRNGKEGSGYHIYANIGGESFSVPQNEFGLPVHNGKVLFPFC